jgi:hypothetical protein
VFTAYYPLTPPGATLLGPKEGKMVCTFNGKSLSRKTHCPRPITGDRPVQQIDICGVDYKTKMKLGSDYTHGVHAAPSSLRQALYLSLFKVLRRVRLQQLLILFSKYDQFK